MFVEWINMWLNIVIIAGFRFRHIILVQELATNREGWTCLCRGKLGQDSVPAQSKTNGLFSPFAFVRHLIAQKIGVIGNVKWA